MKKEKIHKKGQVKRLALNQDHKTPVRSYRLQCVKAGNGLSHYVMYGDEKNSLV